jgi:hypothetical protein
VASSENRSPNPSECRSAILTNPSLGLAPGQPTPWTPAVTGSDATRVVVCAGGLGTRTASWSRYIPKEFYPVGGRPGIVHLLEEIAQLAPAEVVIVCHPYYRMFTAWARTALGQQAHDRYARQARLRPEGYPAAGLTVSFITQRGPYADLTSVLNGADHLAVQGDMYIAFADNLYPQDDPAHPRLHRLRPRPPGTTRQRTEARANPGCLRPHPPRQRDHHDKPGHRPGHQQPGTPMAAGPAGRTLLLRGTQAGGLLVEVADLDGAGSEGVG